MGNTSHGQYLTWGQYPHCLEVLGLVVDVPMGNEVAACGIHAAGDSLRSAISYALLDPLN